MAPAVLRDLANGPTSGSGHSGHRKTHGLRGDGNYSSAAQNQGGVRLGCRGGRGISSRLRAIPTSDLTVFRLRVSIGAIKDAAAGDVRRMVAGTTHLWASARFLLGHFWFWSPGSMA